MFSIEEINILIEALDAWESSSSTGALMGSMLSMMLIDDKEKAKKEADQHAEEARLDRESKTERSILLKAKLIQLKDSITTKNASEFMSTGG